jgi:hypothetical protein
MNHEPICAGNYQAWLRRTDRPSFDIGFVTVAYQFLQERMLANYRYSHQGLSWYQKVRTSSDALHLFCSRQTGCKFDDEIPIKTQLYTTMCQTIGRRKTLWPTRLVRTCLAARDLCFIVYCGLGVLNNW